VANRIDGDAKTINESIDRTIAIAGAIKGDTGNIVGQAVRAEQTSHCIQAKLQPLGSC
jgi:hypothetical protein